jgi:hypothetical protein
MSLDDYRMTDISEVVSYYPDYDPYPFDYRHTVDVEFDNNEVIILDDQGRMKDEDTHVFDQIDWESSTFTEKQQQYMENVARAVGKI